MTCLCLTRNRRQWLPQAIQCFQAQTIHQVEAVELLIVADGVDVRDLLPMDNRIRLIAIEEGRTIGEKRNFGVSQAEGEFIAHWDDDDYSAPNRLMDQLRRLRQSGKSVMGYHSCMFTNGARWWRWASGKGNVVGTSLCYRKAWVIAHPFIAKQVGEDGAFSDHARLNGELISADGDAMIAASIHARNTSPRTLERETYTETGAVLVGAEALIHALRESR